MIWMCVDLIVLGTLKRLEQMPSPSNIDMSMEQEVHHLFLNWRPPGSAWEGPPPQLVHPGEFPRFYLLGVISRYIQVCSQFVMICSVFGGLRSS